MDAATNRRRVPVDLARAGEARHFIAWRGAVAGLGGGRLNEMAVAAEAVLTDVLLSAREGALEIESEHDEEVFRISIKHPEVEERRMRDLEGVLQKFLDGHEITPTRAVLVKRLR
jgi:hypothetical protein